MDLHVIGRSGMEKDPGIDGISIPVDVGQHALDDDPFRVRSGWDLFMAWNRRIKKGPGSFYYSRQIPEGTGI